MEKRVALELRGRTPSQVKELNLDNCRSTSIVALSDEYTNLDSLSLNNVGLTSLKGFPTLPKLKKLELSDNRISSGLNFLSGCKKLTHLNLSGNKIKDIEDLKPLEVFKNLKSLDLFNNEVTSIEDYRNKVFTLIPSLRNLDGFDKLDREAEEDTSEEEDEMNGNVDSEEDGSGVEEEEDDEDEDVSLSAVYNDNLEEESSVGSLYEGSVEEEEEEYEDGEGDNDADGEHNSKAQDNGEADHEPEESTRGKKRKHEDDDDDN